MAINARCIRPAISETIESYVVCPMSNFAFLRFEWPEVFTAASRAESLVYPDPRAACFYARRALEFAVQWLYKAERALTLPYQDNLAALLAEPSFAALATPRIATIAISVDMLDTGIDVPEVVNLVFFKLVRSKTKFWQMVGRGTRLCPNLFGPGKDKQNFKIFDVCGNLEFFSQPMPAIEGSNSPGLSERLFGLRVELIAEFDAATQREANDAYHELRSSTAKLLREQVAAMPLDNFLVRTKRRLVEKYSEPSAWEGMGITEQGELVREVAGLPSGIADSDLDAKQFDLLLLACN
jgi:type I restriction enzyme, R subunit